MSEAATRHPLFGQIVGDDAEAIAEPRHWQRPMADDGARPGRLDHRRRPAGLPGVVEPPEGLAAHDVVLELHQGLEDAVDLHRDLIMFREITANQQTTLERFACGESSFVSEENRDYFRDVLDHNRHLHHRAVQGVERLAWALEATKAADARRTQSAIRWGVAFVTAVLLPMLVLSLLSLQVIDLSERLGPALLGAVAAYVVGVGVIFKQKRWF